MRLRKRKMRYLKILEKLGKQRERATSGQKFLKKARRTK
jgi:hypothetical protein